MNDLELAEEIERRRGGTDMLNSVLMPHQWDQIIAALCRGPGRNVNDGELSAAEAEGRKG